MADDAVLSAELVLDDSSALATVENVGSALSEATNIDVNVGGEGAGAATQQVQQLGSAAEKTSGQLKGATDSTALLSGAAGIATGSTGGLRGVVGGLGLGAVGAVAGVTALAGGIGALFDIGVQAQGALDRFNATFGKLADSARQVDVGNLNKDLGDLAIQLGSDDEAALSAAASVYQLGTNSGLTSAQAIQMEKNIAALAARSVALKPTLGDVGSVMEQMSVRLARGGVFAARLGVSLTQSEIAAKAAELGLKGVDGQLSAGEKSFAASVVAAEKYGNTLNQTVAKGAQNSIIQQRSLKEQIDNFIEDAGKPLVMPMFEVIRAAMPVVGAFASSLSSLAKAVLPAVAIAADTVATPLSALGSAISFLSPLIAGGAGAWLAYRGALLIIPALAGAAAAALERLAYAANSGALLNAAIGIQGMGAALASVVGVMGAVLLGGMALGKGLAAAFGQAPEMIDNTAKAMQNLSKATDDNIAGSFEAIAVGRAYINNTSVATERLKAFREAAEQNYGTALRLAQALGRGGDNIEKYRDILADVARGQKQTNKDTQAGTDALNDNADASQNAADAAKQLADIQDQLAKATDDATNAILDEWDAQLKLEKAQQTVAEKIDAYNEAVASGDPQKAADAARDLKDAISASAKAAGDAASKEMPEYASAQAKANASTEATVAELIRVRDTLAPGSPLRTQLGGYIAQLLGIPPERGTTITLEAADAIAKLRILLGLAQTYAAIVSNLPTLGGGYAPPLIPQGIHKGRDGHWYDSGGNIVGQHGVLVPGRPGDMTLVAAHAGERILSADETRNGWGGGAGVVVQGSTFQFNQPIYGVNELERAMRDMLAEHDRQLEQKLRVMR